MDDDTQNDNLAHDPAQQPDGTSAAGLAAQDARIGGSSSQTSAPSSAPLPPTDEPAFPDHIRFEIGHVSELKDWIVKWFDWKVDQLRSAPYQYEPSEPPAEQT